MRSLGAPCAALAACAALTLAPAARAAELEVEAPAPAWRVDLPLEPRLADPVMLSPPRATDGERAEIERAEVDATAGAPAELEPAARDAQAATGGLRARAVDAARRQLGRKIGGDCSGFVMSAWRAAGLEPPLGRGRSRSESLARASVAVERPRPGDLAFFDHTYDRNHDGKADDRYTHVALVEEVDGDDVTLLHRGAGRVERVRMNLARPADPELNDPVRRLRKRDRPGTRVLAGELFAGYGAVRGADLAPDPAERAQLDPPRRCTAGRRVSVRER